MPRTHATASTQAPSASPSSALRARWPSSVQLSELGELGLLEELERRGLVERIENDAAELDGGRIVTQDALLEGIHFRLDWISWRDLGYRAAAVNISDLSASGAEPASRGGGVRGRAFCWSSRGFGAPRGGPPATSFSSARRSGPRRVS